MKLVVFSRHPRSDIRRTVAKHNPPAGFVLSQDTDRVTICEDEIGKVQHKDTPRRLYVYGLAEFAHAASVKLTADCEHHRTIPDAVDFQHRPLPRTQLPGQLKGSRNQGDPEAVVATFRQW